MILFCVVFLSIRSENISVSALRSIDLALKWGEERLFSRNRSASVEELNTQWSLAPTPSLMFDPNQSNKRRVQRGSDPIHNRC
ncbi:hypothetical protein Ccrd_015250 [Cynara cardunculus var. scolymus]|uniref:Uncharacterized protein n=1 Tax=Cynara cardunculus var. scolymus TaxID=59895 RepID=A0A103YC54_CYNCS|nr:hypothetical protein Ccrd_015250 [Cynara cardunculus var. scolymus]